MLKEISIFFKDNKLHREDRPAVEHASGNKFWYLNGEFHREDGPAIMLYDKCYEWWFNGKNIYCTSQKEFKRIMKIRAFI